MMMDGFIVTSFITTEPVGELFKKGFLRAFQARLDSTVKPLIENSLLRVCSEAPSLRTSKKSGSKTSNKCAKGPF
jgi:hypothetical protein